MNEKKYLKWNNKLGYGSGDIAANCIYALLTSFLMIYLTDTVGLKPEIVGFLIMVSKLLDGVTDLFFGNLLDRTHSKMGKARPWMLWTEIGNCVCLVVIFAIPRSFDDTVKYVYFFIAYVMLNAVFYTANNIAYGALNALITKNSNERVQMGSIRYMFALATDLIISYITIDLVTHFGGGAQGWRTVAIIYAAIALISNTVAVFSVKELPEEGIQCTEIERTHEKNEKISLLKSFGLLFQNKYFIMLLLLYIVMYLQSGVMGSAGIYYMTYVLGDASLLGSFSIAQMLPVVIGCMLTPFLVKKMNGMYKVNLIGYVLAVVFRIVVVIGGYLENIPLMLAAAACAALFRSPLTGDVNALISAAADYTFYTKGVHIEGSIFSCTSIGIKLGGGIGSAIFGLLLAAGGYVNGSTSQPVSALNMIRFLYLWVPLIGFAIITLILVFMKVEKANVDLEMQHGGERSTTNM